MPQSVLSDTGRLTTCPKSRTRFSMNAEKLKILRGLK